jgi:hypothetical protein
MGWLTIGFLTCFILGLTFTVGAFLLSCLDRFSRVLARPPRRRFNSWLNFNAAAVLLTWFGAAGFIFRSLEIGGILTLTLASLMGLLGYGLIVLYAFRLTHPPKPPETAFNGTVGRVNQVAGGKSEIVFYSGGQHLALPARPADGRRLTPGTPVVIVNQERGVALVEDLDRFLVRTGAEKWSSAYLKSARLKEPRL